MLNTITLSDSSLTIAADASGQLYGASYQSILHYDTNGILLDSHPVITEGYLYTLALSPDNRFVVVSDNGEVVIVDADFIPLHSFRIITGSYAYAAIIPESSTGDVDSDGDGIPDDQDNCIDMANGPAIPDAGGNSQRDTDNDGYGNICDVDFTQNGVVDTTDLSITKKALRTTAPDQDLNGNGVVDSTDYSIARGFLRHPPGPSCCGITLP